MSTVTCRVQNVNHTVSNGLGAVRSARRELPCRTGNNPDLWFADTPADLERAKQLCAGCPIRTRCLTAALDRAEPWGVWGGEILEQGAVIARKRPRGRPRKHPVPQEDPALVCA